MRATIITLLLLVTPSIALTGYDCTGEGLNITTFSLTDIGECSFEDMEPTKEDAYIQLMQLSDFTYTQVMQCKVEVDRTLYYCGMHHHVSIVHGGRRQYVREVLTDARDFIL